MQALVDYGFAEWDESTRFSPWVLSISLTPRGFGARLYVEQEERK